MRVRRSGKKLFIEAVDDHEALMLSSALNIASADARTLALRDRSRASQLDARNHDAIKLRRQADDQDASAAEWERLRALIDIARQGD